MHKKCPSCGSQYPAFKGKCLVCGSLIELNYFDVLGIDITNDIKTIKKSYYKKIMQCHPDKVEKLSKEFKRLADKKTKQLNTIWNTLKNNQLREDYIESLYEYFDCCYCNESNRILINDENFFHCDNCHYFIDKYDISAHFVSVNIKHGVREKYAIGMSIKIDFNVCNSYDEVCDITACFFNNDSPEKNSSKSLYLTRYFIPKYKNTTYKDFNIFVPYHKLYFNVGSRKFKLCFIIHNEEKNEISTSDWFYFKNRFSF